MASKEVNMIQPIMCPVDKCGRRFDDEEKMMTHIQRRHPEYDGTVQQKEDKKQQQLNISNINPTRRRSSSRDNIIQQQIPKKDISIQPSESDASLNLSQKSQIISTEIPLNKEINTSRLQQRPPSSKSSANIKPPSSNLLQQQQQQQQQQLTGASESMRRSQDLFRKTQENNQLIEKIGTVASSQKEPVRPSSSKLEQRSLSNSQQGLKQQKPLLKASQLKLEGQLAMSQQGDAQIKGQDKNQNEKIAAASNASQDLIKSIQFYIQEAEKREASKIECQLPKEEVLSEEEEEGGEQKDKRSSYSNSRPSTANKGQILSGDGSQLSLTSNQDKQKQVSIQEIIACKKKITAEYLLSNSSNECDDIGFIESLNLNEQNLIVFEDGLTDAKFDIMVSLEYLSLSKNQLVNIISLSKFSSSLKELNINFNKIVDINPLYECVHLEKLWASHNLISNITCLKKLKNLKIISLYNNQITSSCVDTLKELQNLQEVDLANNPCSDSVNYKYDILSVVKLKVLDSVAITPQELQMAKTFANNNNNKAALTTNTPQNRPGSAPLKINPRTGLSASMIVNNQKQLQQSTSNTNKDYHKLITYTNNQEYQTTTKIAGLEKTLSDIQQRQAELREVIRQTKKINKSLATDIESQEKENIILREQSGQIEQARQYNKTLLRKIGAYESTIILHQEGPDELKQYLRSLNNQVKQLEEKNSKLHQENEELENMEDQFINGDDGNSDDSDYNPEKINELLLRSTAAFSQIKSDLKILHKAKK